MFGNAHDLYVADNANTNGNSYVRCGTAFESVNGQCGDHCGVYVTSTGGPNYPVADIEVFYYSDFDSAIIPPHDQGGFLTSIGLALNH